MTPDAESEREKEEEAERRLGRERRRRRGRCVRVSVTQFSGLMGQASLNSHLVGCA